MNIEVFVERRKEKGYSQIELAQGICTQATLSRFEKNGQVPNLKIVLALCNRLNLPIGDLFPTIEIEYSIEIEKMNQAEFFLITSEYDQAQALLNTIQIEDIENDLILFRYHYIKGYIMIFKEAPINHILFNFDQILLDNHVMDSEIFRLLSYTGVGMAYQRDKDFTKAAFYFNKVLDQIHDYPIKETEDTWRVLNIVYQCGEFYSNIKEFEVGNALLQYVVEICSHNHVTYYLARAAYQLALNSIELNKEKDSILELICDARSFAKINKNEILLNKILVLEKNLFQVGDCNKLESKLE